MSGQVFAPVALNLRKEPVFIKQGSGGLGGPQSRSRRFVEEKYLLPLPLPGFKPRVHQSVA